MCLSIRPFKLVPKYFLDEKVQINIFVHFKTQYKSLLIIQSLKHKVFILYFIQQTPLRRLTKMSIKGKIATCVKKIFEAAKACESLNALEATENGICPKVQAFFMLDSGKKSHISGYGTMFEQFVNTQQLGNYTGKGTNPVDANDPNHRNSLLQIETYPNKGKTHKRKHWGTSNNDLCYFLIA